MCNQVHFHYVLLCEHNTQLLFLQQLHKKNLFLFSFQTMFLCSSQCTTVLFAQIALELLQRVQFFLPNSKRMFLIQLLQRKQFCLPNREQFFLANSKGTFLIQLLQREQFTLQRKSILIEGCWC